MGRSLINHPGDAATWPEWQDEALIHGYKSVAEYAISECIREIKELKARVDVLEGHLSEENRVELPEADYES